MILYKLTNKLGQTYHGTQWAVGSTWSATGSEAQPLCTNGWIHAYESKELAILLNPIHGAFDPLRMFEAEGEVGLRDGQLKCGTHSLTIIREIEPPIYTTNQRVAFAIFCAQSLEQTESWKVWAENWLSGKDRSRDAAWAAARAAAWAAARDAAWDAARDAARAAARDAAWDAARDAARAAAWDAARDAARAAAGAAAWAAARAAKLDLQSLALKALEFEKEA